MKLFNLIIGLTALASFAQGQETVKEYKITKQYLNFPIVRNQERQKVTFMKGRDTLTFNVIRVAETEPDYWVFTDVSAYKGETLRLTFPKAVKGIDKIYQSDAFAGQDSLYKETNRPQFHFSSRRGWNNDPNGLVYDKGEYHLFYQHNPYESEWENMTWGHAVSKDLVHWTELNDALYPDKIGTMFSGSAVVDKDNTSGWGKGALVAMYTADSKTETQCVAYSLDNGRTFTKYAGNPVIRPERFASRDSRDPKVIWYEPNKEWSMVMYEEAGLSFFTSKNLKEWKFESHLPGFFECAELFQLPVDNDPKKMLWVTTAASGTYMLGDFDGKKFTPKYGKYRTTYGNQYAAQTYNNTPDGKRIQIGWGTIQSKGMSFNQMMCFPTELTLRNTKEGVRLFSQPIGAISKLHAAEHNLSGLTADQANEKLGQIKTGLLHVVARLESLSGAAILMDYQGNRIATMDGDEINGAQTPQPNPGSLFFDVELLIDRTSVESFYQNGQAVFVAPINAAKKVSGLEFMGDRKAIKIHKLMVYELKSAW
jgi:sucrose-6-phosphate hydrolase SacC (GH32 family)